MKPWGSLAMQKIHTCRVVGSAYLSKDVKELLPEILDNESHCKDFVNALADLLAGTTDLDAFYQVFDDLQAEIVSEKMHSKIEHGEYQKHNGGLYE
jgi:hypothetical protein